MDRNDLIENHSSAIAEAMQNHFGVPVSVSKSKTPYGVSHYVKPQFDLPQFEVPFTVRVSDHAAWVPRHHQIEHHVYPKENDHPKKFIDESIGAAKEYGKRVGLFPKDEFVPLIGDVYHPTFGTGKIIDSKPDVAKVDFGSKGVKNISSRFLQPVDPHNPDITKSDGGPITAYHGSPHDFEQFDTSKIGTGEGAQSYGHGLYFAEHEPVAEGYRDSLNPEIRNIVGYAGPDRAKNAASYLASNIKEEEIIDALRSLGDKNPEHSLENGRQILKNAQSKGHMYEVAIDAHPDHFLDWDKPLSEQSDHVRDAFDLHKDLVHSNPYLETFFNNVSGGQHTGSQIYDELSDKNAVGLGKKGASDFLHSMGIKGVKYLDAGSRNAEGKGTHNYVVFDHNRVNVKRKYEQGGAVDNNPDITKAKGGTIDREKVDYKQMPHSPIVEHVLHKISAPLPALDPHLLAAIAGRRS